MHAGVQARGPCFYMFPLAVGICLGRLPRYCLYDYSVEELLARSRAFLAFQNFSAVC